jgi:hypothetical protein
MKGNIINKNPVFGLTPIIPKLLGLAENCENTVGFDPSFDKRVISTGTAPIVFATIKTTANIKKYLQKLFLPVNVDSRWFIVKIYSLSEFRTYPFRIIY